MMKKEIKIILCALIGISAVFFLAFFSLRSGAQKNGFLRVFSMYPPRQQQELDVLYSSYYFAGLSSSHIFLGNHRAPFHILRLNYGLSDTAHISLPLRRNQGVQWGLTELIIDSSSVYITEPMTPSWLRTTITDSNVLRYNIGKQRFERSQIISPESMVIKFTDAKTGQGIIQKIQANGLLPLSYKMPATENGTFAHDGFFSFGKRRQSIVFTYFYKNRFLCLDTNLNLVFEGKTIDTNNVAKVSSVEVGTGEASENILSSPPLQVNKRSYIDGNLLYIYAALPSDTESKEEFKKYTVLDIYDLARKGRYHHSIKIPNFGNQKVTSFAVKESILAVLYKHNIRTYKL